MYDARCDKMNNINETYINLNTSSISLKEALAKLALMALQGFEGSGVNAAPGAMMTPSVTPRCIIIFHVFLIPRTLIHKKNPPFGTLKSAKPVYRNG